MIGIPALPRWLARTRRRKPRPPAWWFWATILAFMLFALAFDVFHGNAQYVAGDAAIAAGLRMKLTHPPCDPDGPLGTTPRHATIAALGLAGLTLLFVP